MSSNSPPPKIYMNMGSRVSDADAGGVPKWVWLMALGIAALAILAAALYLMATAPL